MIVFDNMQQPEGVNLPWSCLAYLRSTELYTGGKTSMIIGTRNALGIRFRKAGFGAFPKPLVCFCYAIILAGCSAFGGYPERLPEDQDVVIANGSVANILNSQNEADRNKAITARLFAIDQNFSIFEKKLFEQVREAGFATTVATLGVTTAGSLTGGVAASILSALGSGFTGARAAYEKEVLGEKTLLAIHTAMRANRTVVRARIQRALPKSLKEYPPGLALADLDEYYFKGTVLGALVTITETVGNQSVNANHELREIYGYSSSQAAEFLNTYFAEPLPENVRRVRVEEVRSEYRKLGVNVDGIATISLVRDPKLDAQTRIVAGRFGWHE